MLVRQLYFIGRDFPVCPAFAVLIAQQVYLVVDVPKEVIDFFFPVDFHFAGVDKRIAFGAVIGFFDDGEVEFSQVILAQFLVVFSLFNPAILPVGLWCFVG